MGLFHQLLEHNEEVIKHVPYCFDAGTIAMPSKTNSWNLRIFSWL